MFNSRLFITGACLVALTLPFVSSTTLGAPPTAAPASAGEAVTFPDTIAGRMAKDYIEAFNSGDADIMGAFEAKRRAKSALKRRSMKDRLDMYRDLYRDWGRIEAVRVA